MSMPGYKIESGGAAFLPEFLRAPEASFNEKERHRSVKWRRIEVVTKKAGSTQGSKKTVRIMMRSRTHHDPLKRLQNDDHEGGASVHKLT